MSSLKETRLSTERIYKGKLLDVWKDKVELPDGKPSYREFIKFIHLSQVDKLEESEIARLEEKKEEEYKPVVMGKWPHLLNKPI